MSTHESFGDVEVTVGEDRVARALIRRPPNNFFDAALIGSLADAYESLAVGDRCRAIVLCSEGRHFCAGADLGGPGSPAVEARTSLYGEAARLFGAEAPGVAALQGAAVGGGLGLACSADFRVASPRARFAANFAQLGFHHGFALSVTLPAIVGQQHALDLLYTGRRVPGDEALGMGLCDRLVEPGELLSAAHELAAGIAASAPLAVRSIRATMRSALAERVEAAMEHEAAEQGRLRGTADFAEGVRATAERRRPAFEGH
jgi:2-(1,2-epoxy-1,2-dihydrophenyl)acetyl-CoA isomerase